jgi:hypothetical protein
MREDGKCACAKVHLRVRVFLARSLMLCLEKEIRALKRIHFRMQMRECETGKTGARAHSQNASLFAPDALRNISVARFAKICQMARNQIEDVPFEPQRFLYSPHNSH